MTKTTVYLPKDLEARLDAEAAASGISKAELIRQGIALRLEQSNRPMRRRELPVFNSGRSLTAEAMDELVHEHISDQARRR